MTIEISAYFVESLQLRFCMSILKTIFLIVVFYFYNESDMAR